MERVVWALVVAAVVAGCSAPEPEPDRDLTTKPTTAEVASALAFCDLAGLPPGATAGPLRREQGIDGLVVLRVVAEDLVPWLAASGLPAPAPSPTTSDVAFGPDLPPGTPVVAQHRAQRPGGGIVFRSATVLDPTAVELTCFET